MAARDYLVLSSKRPYSNHEPFSPLGRSPFKAEVFNRLDVDPVPIDIARERLSPREVREIARDSSTLAIAPNMPTRLIAPTAKNTDVGSLRSDAATTWGIQATGADVSPWTGRGVTVAILDTGIDEAHPAFDGVKLVQKDFTGTGNGDGNGHGTHCAGTVFGREVDGLRIGVAPGVAQALIGKVLDNSGSGTSQGLFAAIRWALEADAHVISMSLGWDFPGAVKAMVDDHWPVELATSMALEDYRGNLRMFDALMGVARARTAFGAGTVVVAASGNESRRHMDSRFEIAAGLPAAADGIIAVGAIVRSDGGLDVASFSNTFADISGPGVGVISAQAGGGLVAFDGTSMATPHVAGLAAQWWEHLGNARPPARSVAVEAKLLATARRTGFAAATDWGDVGAGLAFAPPAA